MYVENMKLALVAMAICLVALFFVAIPMLMALGGLIKWIAGRVREGWGKEL